MNKAGRSILLLSLSIGCTGALYFFSVLLHLPFILTIALIVLSIFFIYKWLPAAGRDTENVSFWPYAILLLALYFIISKTNTFSSKHGEPDAWTIWNYRAFFLQYPAMWKNMLLTSSAHPDYPLCLSATLAFLHRITAGRFPLSIPFGFSFIILICIPAWVYLEQYKKNIIVASAALFLFVTDDFYFIRGLSEYADTLLAFFFLGAFICINHAAENKKYIALSAAFIACCAWTKNEGVVLSGVFALFYARALFSKANLKYTIAGVALPLAALLIFKIAYAPPNDMVQGQNKSTISNLLDHSRYALVWDFFVANLSSKFSYLRLGFYLYFLLCVIEKKWPGKQMLLLITCMLAYFVIYIVTPRDLSWQLATSQDRLMHQLMPAMVYVIAARLSGIQILLPQKQAL